MKLNYYSLNEKDTYEKYYYVPKVLEKFNSNCEIDRINKICKLAEDQKRCDNGLIVFKDNKCPDVNISYKYSGNFCTSETPNCYPLQESGKELLNEEIKKEEVKEEVEEVKEVKEEVKEEDEEVKEVKEEVKEEVKKEVKEEDVKREIKKKDVIKEEVRKEKVNVKKSNKIKIVKKDENGSNDNNSNDDNSNNNNSIISGGGLSLDIIFFLALIFIIYLLTENLGLLNSTKDSLPTPQQLGGFKLKYYI